MASDTKPVVFDEDNPEWTEEDFARARPAAEVLPAEVLAAFSRGPREKAGEQITLDSDVLAKFRATGPGWQARVNDALRAAPTPTARSDAA